MKGIIIRVRPEIVANNEEALGVSDALCEMIANGAVLLGPDVDVVGVETDDDMICWAPMEAYASKDEDHTHDEEAEKQVSGEDCYSKEPVDQAVREEVAIFLRTLADEIDEQ